MSLIRKIAERLKVIFMFMTVMPWAFIGRLWGRNVWLISERPGQARDNGYCFYKYVRENYPEQRIIYLIDKSASDYEKIRKYKSIIQFDSWAHYYYYCLSKIHISSQRVGCRPTNSTISKCLKKLLSYKDIFLPHGVSYGVSEFCLKKNALIDLFICSGYPEYKNVLDNYGYSEREVAYTGFPRLDLWHEVRPNKKQILIMPTWRAYIAQDPETDFCDTTYFKVYQALINDERLGRFLEINSLELVFYLHNEMQKYAHFFQATCPSIKIIQPFDECDIQELLKTSALLVTDYSSVHFDFAYMNKPVIYYQFDKEEFFSKQYAESEFSAETDGFGPVLYEKDPLIDEIMSCVNHESTVEEKYHERMRAFYQLYDNHNCERVYHAIMDRCAADWK